jgi:hypothetical protein
MGTPLETPTERAMTKFEEDFYGLNTEAERKAHRRELSWIMRFIQWANEDLAYKRMLKLCPPKKKPIVKNRAEVAA